MVAHDAARTRTVGGDKTTTSRAEEPEFLLRPPRTLLRPLFLVSSSRRGGGEKKPVHRAGHICDANITSLGRQRRTRSPAR
ncbi:hypothetical protein MRX96_011154 [Rhipicephalus microplus]